jgi:Flp pilus assembly protein TadG
LILINNGSNQQWHCRVIVLDGKIEVVVMASAEWSASISAELGALARRFCRSNRGSVAIMMGITLTVTIGVAGLGAEITFLLFRHRQLQTVADAAALSAAAAMQAGYPTFDVEARAVAASLNFPNGVNGVAITPNNPPGSGAYARNTGAVEVIASQPQTLAMVGLVSNGLFNVTARAVAIVGTGSSCVLQFSPGSATGVTISNGAAVNLIDCGLSANSTSGSAISVTGGATLTAQSVSTSGSTSIRNGGAIKVTGAIKTNQAAVPDPYASVAMPALPGGCMAKNTYGHGTWVLSPGRYCGGLSLTNDAIVTMSAGVYFVDQGTFSVGGAVLLTGANVTIVLTASTGGGYATVSIGNGANVTLSAPTSGATAGIVFFGDRRAPASNTQNFEGGAVVNITGAIYFPTQQVVFANGASNPSSCTQLIAGTIQFQGGSRFQDDCPTGVASIGSSNPTLVE